MKKSTIPLGLNGIYVGRDRSAAQNYTGQTSNIPEAVPQIPPVPVPTMSPPPRPVINISRPVITPSQPTHIAPPIQTESNAGTPHNKADGYPLHEERSSSEGKSSPPPQREGRSSPPPQREGRSSPPPQREGRSSPPPAREMSPPKTKSILKKSAPVPATSLISQTSGRTSGESRDTSVSPPRKDRAQHVSSSPIRSSASSMGMTDTQPLKKPVPSTTHPITPKSSVSPRKQGSFSSKEAAVSPPRERKLNSPPPSSAMSGKRDIAAGISRPLRVLPQSAERGGSESTWSSQSNHVGKTLRSQKMEARLRNAPDSDSESDYYSRSQREGSYDSPSQASYSTYGDSSSYREGRNQVYQPDTKTFGVGGALAVRTQRILQKQKKLEGLSADRTRREYDDQSMLSTIEDDGRESDEENERSKEDMREPDKERGSGSPAVYYVMSPGDSGSFPPGYLFPTGFDPSMLVDLPPRAKAMGPDGQPLSEETRHTLEAQRVAIMQQYMQLQQMMAAQGGGGPDTAVQGGGGPDTAVQGGGGPDTAVQGGGGSDTIVQGGGGPDTAVQGGGGPDTAVQGGGGPDTAVQGGGGLNSAAVAVLMQQQQANGAATGGIPGGLSAQTLAMAEQLVALNAHNQTRGSSATNVPPAVPDDPLGIDLQTLLMAKQLASLNEKLKSVGGIEGGAQADPNALYMLLAQLGAAGVQPAPPPVPAAAPGPDMSLMNDTLTQMRDMMLELQKMQVQAHPPPQSPAPVYHFIPPPKPNTIPSVAPTPLVSAPPPEPESERRKTQRELPPVLYRLVPHRSKFKRANELFDADVDTDYYSDENSSIKATRSHRSSRSRAPTQASDKKSEKAKRRNNKRGEEADFSLESFAPPRNGGVGGDERYTVSSSSEGEDDSRELASTKARSKDGSKDKEQGGGGKREARTSQFKFDNPLLSPADPTPTKSQDDFWIDPSIEDRMVDKFRRDSKDDLEIERKSSLLSLTSNTVLYKKKVDLSPGYRREILRDSCSSTASCR